MNMTKGELVKVIIETDHAMGDNVDTIGFDWPAVATENAAAKDELVSRFGVAVGYGGIIYSLPENAP